MKYLIVDDEHELYERMFSDLFCQNIYEVEEIPRVRVPFYLELLYKLHFNPRINNKVFLPFKSIWRNYYGIENYSFNKDEEYFVIILNGSLRLFFSNNQIKQIKDKHPNVHFVLIMYDSCSNPSAKRAVSMVPSFDDVFSFDSSDCKKNGWTHFYSTFSFQNPKKNPLKHSSAFFIGYGQGRLKLLQDTFEVITSVVDNCKFFIAGVHNNDRREIKGVTYNRTMSYSEEIEMAYNTECIVEILKEGQSGITLRTCEAISFNKKLLTNNQSLLDMPFYDERYMKVFHNADDIDIDFIKSEERVHYTDSDYFSPVKIIEYLYKKYS